MANNLNIDSERVAFEVWATSKKWSIKRANEGSADDYMDTDTEIAWYGWQAKASAGAPLASAPATEPFAWIVVRDNTGEHDGGEPMCDKYEADEYIKNQSLPGWHLEAIYRAPLPAPGEAGELAKLREALDKIRTLADPFDGKIIHAIADAALAPIAQQKEPT